VILTLLGAMRINFLTFKRFILSCCIRNLNARKLRASRVIFLLIAFALLADIESLGAASISASPIAKPRCLLIKVGGAVFCWTDDTVRGVIDGERLEILGVRPNSKGEPEYFITQDVSLKSKELILIALQKGEVFSLPAKGKNFLLVADYGNGISLKTPLLKVQPKLQYLLVKNGLKKMVLRPDETMRVDESESFEIIEVQTTFSQEIKLQVLKLSPQLDQLNATYRDTPIGAVYFSKKAQL